VFILLDSITRLARAYNTVQPHSGTGHRFPLHPETGSTP
jgi:transcription termination factor Rho